MKSAVLVAALSAGAAAAFVAPQVQHTVTPTPWSARVVLPLVTAPVPGTNTVSVGTLPRSVILTDILIGNDTRQQIDVLVNSVPVLTLPRSSNPWQSETVHLNSGILLPAGCMLGISSSNGGGSIGTDCVLTLVGTNQ